MRKIFIHLHIPKCGGSSVSDLLARNFGSALGDTNSILNDYQYTSEQVAKIIDHFPKLQCLTGHKLSLDLPVYRKDLDITAFTWIRDPVDRFVSHYFYHRNHTTLVPEAKSMPLEEYIRWALEEGNQRMYINGQTQFLAGGDLNIIKEKVNTGLLLLFPLSKLDKSLFTLASRFPDHFNDWRLQTRNVSKKDQQIPPDIRERVAPFVEKDLLLLDLAMQTRTEEPPNNAFTFPCSVSRLRTLPRKMSYVLHRVANKLEKLGK